MKRKVNTHTNNRPPVLNQQFLFAPTEMNEQNKASKHIFPKTNNLLRFA